MEAGNRSEDAHAQEGSGSGFRNRRRRDREKERPNYGGDQSTNRHPQHRSDYEIHVNIGEHGDGHGMKTGSSRSSRNRRDHTNGHSQHYGDGHWGQRDGRVNRHHRGGWNDYYQYTPEAPWPTPEEDHSLKDLLSQVAPQARIVENTSRLSSKASANILSKVLSEAAHNTGSADMNGKLDYGEGIAGASSSTNGHPGTGLSPEDDEESAFMERWSGLFSKGSPLVEGSLQDPFEDVKKRTKVVWKKDRKGHRTRQQARKLQKEKEEPQMYDGDADAEGYASVVYDASQTQWRPQRPPVGM
jgi:hypothetical protein